MVLVLCDNLSTWNVCGSCPLCVFVVSRGERGECVLAQRVSRSVRVWYRTVKSFLLNEQVNAQMEPPARSTIPVVLCSNLLCLLLAGWSFFWRSNLKLLWPQTYETRASMGASSCCGGRGSVETEAACAGLSVGL